MASQEWPLAGQWPAMAGHGRPKPAMAGNVRPWPLGIQVLTVGIQLATDGIQVVTVGFPVYRPLLSRDDFLGDFTFS